MFDSKVGLHFKYGRKFEPVMFDSKVGLHFKYVAISGALPVGRLQENR